MINNKKQTASGSWNMALQAGVKVWCGDIGDSIDGIKRGFFADKEGVLKDALLALRLSGLINWTALLKTLRTFEGVRFIEKTLLIRLPSL